MKKLLLAAALALPMAAQAGDVNGTWATATNETGGYLHVDIGPCASNAALTCGTITGNFGGAPADHNGKPIIWDMQANGEDRWRRGRIWAPDDDKTYKSKMSLNGNSLNVEGCVAIFCRGQVWTRVN